MNTRDVENFPGFPEGVLGPDLMGLMYDQAARFCAQLLRRDVVSCDLVGEVKSVTDDTGEVHRARAIVIATGAAHRRLGVAHEDRLSGHGVSWCATCDGFFFRAKEVAVVGGGDSAVEEAMFLTRFADRVTIIHRRDALRASKLAQHRALANERIRFAWNSEIVALKGDKSLTGVVLADRTSGDTSTLNVSGLFVAIGHEPRSALFRGQLELDPEGYVRVQSPSTRTSLPGVFACGDVVDRDYRQAITAAGTGCTAALDADHFLADDEAPAGEAVSLAVAGAVG